MSWPARRRRLASLAPYLSRDDVAAAARALAAEAGLEVAVEPVNEQDGDEDMGTIPAPPTSNDVHTTNDAVDLAGDGGDDVPEAVHDELDVAERRRAVLAETDAMLAKGRQWDELWETAR